MLEFYSDVTLTPTDGRWRYALPIGKGQLISKVIYGLLSSPKKQTDKFVLFAFFTLHGKQIKFVRSFLGESTARQSAFWFYLTFSGHTLTRNFSNCPKWLIFGCFQEPQIPE